MANAQRRGRATGWRRERQQDESERTERDPTERNGEERPALLRVFGAVSDGGGGGGGDDGGASFS
ncbi:hypothetical protein ALC62_08393 [Cyphomyrmex costatus]|uniref:Uncharacterized protein n=1 Tax=Cyphomyrmex costatus TaxID=456900 RepID=A0A151IH47_9HYME|nr:hypothetical protein ALC62_08393 [Cyphomyrmex costatus]